VKEKVNTREIKRNESNQKILNAAVRCFGKSGYSNTSIAEIAREAGVAVGLITKRFDKITLLNTAYGEVARRAFSSSAENGTFSDTMLGIVRYARKLRTEKPEEFRFIRTLLNSPDVPKEHIEESRRNFFSSLSREYFENAQKKGMIPAGDPYRQNRAMWTYIFNHIDDCVSYGVELPDDEAILKSVLFLAPEERKQEHRRDEMLMSFCSTFSVITYIDIQNNTAEQMRAPEFLVPFADITDVRGAVTKAVDGIIAEEDVQKMKEFLNIDTVEERLRTRNCLHCTAADREGRRQLHTLIPLKYDSEGRLREIIAGVQIL